MFTIGMGNPSFAASTINVEDAEKACSSGNVEGCGNLSVFEFEAGNIENAKINAKKACDGNAMRGCNVLALILKNSDISEAKQLFEKACEKDHIKGCINLGILEYEKGNKKAAMKALKKSCDREDFFGCDRLGLIENEMGNKDEAKKLFKKACEGNEKIGCTNLGVSEHTSGNKVEAERLWKKSCNAGDPSACRYFENILNDKANLYEQSCSQNDMSACYNYGLIRVKRKDPENLVLQVFQKACDGNELRACDEIKSVLTKACVNRRLKLDRDCYTQGPVQRLSSGTSIIPSIRVHNDSCDKREKQTLQGLGCADVGDLEAKRGNFNEAEKIYKDGCTGHTNNEGCSGLVCIGYQKMNQKKEAEAKKLFKIACDNSKTKTESLPGSEGCFAIPTPPSGNYNKKNFSELIEKAKRDMVDKEAQCIKNWERAWGPKLVGN